MCVRFLRIIKRTCLWRIIVCVPTVYTPPAFHREIVLKINARFFFLRNTPSPLLVLFELCNTYLLRSRTHIIYRAIQRQKYYFINFIKDGFSARKTFRSFSQQYPQYWVVYDFLVKDSPNLFLVSHHGQLRKRL